MLILTTGDHHQRRRITRDQNEAEMLGLPPDGFSSSTMSNNHRWMLYKMAHQQQDGQQAQDQGQVGATVTSSVIARLEPEAANNSAQQNTAGSPNIRVADIIVFIVDVGRKKILLLLC